MYAPNEADGRLGSVILQRHQIDGVARLRDRLARHKGALLADEVGLGKTYTALGVARHYGRVTVVAPAALRAMWHEACSRCDVAADFVSAESLSRSAPAQCASELMLVDEAHWFRNPATRRYRRLALLCRNTAVLLLTATPVHNRPADVAALFALFLGPRASRLAAGDTATLTVRRDRSRLGHELTRAPPEVTPTVWWQVPSDPRVVAVIDAITAPVPPRDGGIARALLRLTLLRRLGSSQAALRTTLRRMLARSLALLDAARAGQHPTARQLCAWLVGDEAIQLALPGLFAVTASDAVPTDLIERHIASLRSALRVIDTARDYDSARVGRLTRLMKQFAGARVVAFSQYDATVRAFARRLRHVPGVAVLSGRGGTIASGQISRAQLLSQFDAARGSVHPSMLVRLLLTTDLLSEGVNLHNAQVVVHLDVPWTPARLEQRVGRLSRLGSPHRRVHVFGFAPPRALREAQQLVTRLRNKWSAGRRRFGESALLARDAMVKQPGTADRGGSYATDQEALLQLVESWLGNAEPTAHASAIVGCASTQTPVALALLRVADGPQLVALEDGRVTTHPSVLLRVAKQLSAGDALAVSPDAIARVTRRFARYVDAARGHAAATNALGTSQSALLARIALATKQASRSARPHALMLAGEIRAALNRAQSAGDVVVLGELSERLLCGRAEEPLRWLHRARAALVGSFPRRPPAAPAESDRIIAILIGT